MLETLGETLKNARDRRHESLQTAAQAANISVTHLQKVEKDVVSAPSPHVLRRLGTALELPYLQMLSMAGYLSEAEREIVAEDESLRQGHHALRGQSLDPSEWRAVGAFINYLKAQRSA